MAEATKDDKPIGDGFENLPKHEQEETQEIIDEIGKETNANPDEPKPKPEEKKPDTPPKEDKKDEKPPEKKEGDKSADEKKPEEQSRKVKLVPAWVLKAAEDQHKKDIEKLETDLAAARTSAKETKEDDHVDDEAPDADLRKKTDAIAKKYGTDPDEEYDRVAVARASVKVPTVEIPKEITDSVGIVKKFADDAQVAAEERLFSDDFEKRIVPLVKAEYGDDVPQTTIDDIREKVKEKAYSEEYGKVPLTTIYKGEDAFRGVIPKKDGGSQASRGGHTAAHEAATAGDDIDITGKVALTDAQIANLSDKDFDTYSEGREKWERSQSKK